MDLSAGTVTVALLAIGFAFGETSDKHLDEDHYVGGQHNPGHDMNVLLGHRDSEEIKNLSPERQRIQMLDIVKQIDKNANNLLSAEELALWIQRVYRIYALNEAEARFPDFDADGDGVVSWEEYNTATRQHLPTSDEPAVPDDPERASLRYLHLKEKRRFDFADVDGAPGLNLTEFFAFTYPSEADRMADFTIEDVLREYDRDADGFISLKEFIGDVRGDEDSSPSQWELEESLRFKDLYDQDKDGKLNRDEQLRWVAPNSYGSAREEALHLIKEMDANGDGQISVAEVLKNQETFVNSEVTSYGRLPAAHDEF